MDATAQHIEQLQNIFPVWNDLSPAQQQTMAAGTTLRHFTPGAHIHGGAGDCMGVIMVLSGSLRVYFLSNEGREITLFSLRDGETCLLSASCALQAVSFEIFIDAETEADVFVIEPNIYDALMEENVHMQAYSYKQIVQRMSSVMQVMERALFASFDCRLAAYLLDRADSRRLVHATHDAIARDLGSAREVVSRTLKQFERDAIVSLERGAVRIIDMPTLRKRAERLAAS